MIANIPANREKLRALAAEVQVARLRLWGRNCIGCGRRFVPENLRRDMALQICPMCANRAEDEFMPVVEGRRDARYELRQYGLETWE